MKNKEILVDIEKSILSSPELRSKKDLIDNFINTINVDSKVAEDFKKYVHETSKKDLDKIINENKLDYSLTYEYLKNSFRDNELKLDGQDFDKLIPKTSFFDNNREGLKEKIADIFKEYFNKYNGIIEWE